MKYTIKDLSEGRVDVINDGTVEELNQVLKLAFPDDFSCKGEYVFYYKKPLQIKRWDFSNFTTLPTQSVKEFLNMKTVTRQQLVKIYSIACTEWKAKIEKMIPFDKDEVSISQEQIDEMFKAATLYQKPTLEEIFGKQEEGRMVKPGDRITSEEIQLYRKMAYTSHNGYIVVKLPSHGWNMINLDDGNRWCEGRKNDSDTISLRKLING